MTDGKRTAEALLVRPGTAERVPLPHGGGFELLADAAATGGSLGVNRLTLADGADGARPHLHALSTELFYVLDGALDLYLDGAFETVGRGGLVVVPPGMPHAFGAAAGAGADLLAVLTPGVDRFDYFRSLGRIQHGLDSFDRLLPEQDRYDVHFLDASDWRSARAATAARAAGGAQRAKGRRMP
ncbi:cupin domain-containing protein [Streptomyces spectabilis]|uniref:Cupin domain-containing protein n=1 Tax=Streptomyces spectabilis TaxID=68270 RepID=A0A5P2X7V8_STRST|nr:cupin domain-containing protein [Streptomyces spectabilis]MBB5108414.1 quercetin dioxygenase-like cupin family protein [Streptomyces spectabilis]MCI3901166.1 cupin domain-containing protein [Streptomyces spectabilis]QEV58656.1 cupin domain-containing protein [Streptomyces spectabilis]GGV46368.1 cupin [Streptomyces spectabilis]